MTASEKIYINARQMEKDCWEFSKELYKNGHDFDIFSGITRGGAQISIYMQEVFSLLSNQNKLFTTIHAQSYTGIGKAGEVVVENIDPLVKRAKEGSRILIVDDIFDRGKTCKAVVDAVTAAVGSENSIVKTAVLYFKPDNRVVEMEPDFYYKTFASDDWIVLPHELEGLSPDELKQKGFELP